MSVVDLSPRRERADRIAAVEERLEGVEERLTQLLDLVADRGKLAHLEPWLTLDELAAHLRCSRRYLDQYAPKMPHRMVGPRRMFRLDHAERWLRDHKIIKEVDGAAR